MCRQKLKRKDFQKTREGSPYYQDEQTWKTDAGQNVLVTNSTKCDKDLKPRFLCLRVSGVLSTAYQTEKTVLRLPREDLHSCKVTLDKHKTTGTYNQTRICV